MTSAVSLIRRKIEGRGVARSPLPDTELLGEIMARRAEERLRPMVKTIIGAAVTTCRVVKLSEAVAEIAIPSTIGLVAVEDASVPAVVNLDCDLSYHLVDLMLGGDSRAAPVPAVRAGTAIDMALGRLHLEALLAAFGEAVATTLDRPLSKGMAIREQRQNISQVRLAPDYVDAVHLGIAFEIGEAARSGRLDLVLPLSTLDVIRASARERDAVADRPDDLWRGAMRRAARTAPVLLDAVLHRQKMTVGTIGALRVGQVIEIPRTAPQAVELVLNQPDSPPATLAVARLGAYSDMKVLKLVTPLEAAVHAHVGKALRQPVVPAVEGPQPAAGKRFREADAVEIESRPVAPGIGAEDQ